VDSVGSAYHYSGRNIVTVFSKYDDVQVALPPPMKGTYLGHAMYTYGNVRKSVDVYDVEKVLKDHFDSKRDLPIENVHFGEDISKDRQRRDATLRNHNVHFELLRDLKDTPLEDVIMTAVARDVHAYAKNHAKSLIRSPTTYSKQIIPITKIGFHDIEGKNSLLESGKADFVLGCDLDANLDFSRGCVAGWTKGTYDGFEPYWDPKIETWFGFLSNKFLECYYCYKIYGHELFPKEFVDVVGRRDELKYLMLSGDFKDFDGKIFGRKVEVLRGGKTTEVGSIYTLPQLITTMEVCLETATKFVFPTKYLEFNPQLLEYMKNPLINVLFSVSAVGHLEPGLNKDGKTVKWRLEQARQFKERGANVGLFHMYDYVYGSKKMDEYITNFANKYHIPIIPLQQTVTNKEVAMPMTGRTWEELIQPWGQHSIDGRIIGGYKKKGNTGLIPTVFNKELTEKLGDNSNPMFSGCAHIDGFNGKTYCAGCGFRPGSIVDTEKRHHPLDLDSYRGLDTNGVIDKYKEDTKNRVKKKPRRVKKHKQPNKLFTKEDFMNGNGNGNHNGIHYSDSDINSEENVTDEE